MWLEVGLILKKKNLLYFPIASGRELSPETGDNTHAVPVSRSCRYGCVPLWELQHSLGLVLPYVNHLAPSRHRSSQSSWPVSSLRLTENLLLTVSVPNPCVSASAMTSGFPHTMNSGLTWGLLPSYLPLTQVVSPTWDCFRMCFLGPAHKAGLLR